MLSKLLLASMVASAPIQEYTTPKQEANQTQIKTNTIGWTRNVTNQSGYDFYFQNWTQNYDTGEYDIYLVSTVKQYELSTEWYTEIQYYFKIQKKGQIIPNNNLTISVTNTLQAEESQSIYKEVAETDSYNYISNLDMYLNAEYDATTTGNINFFDEKLYNHTGDLNYNYDYFIEQDTTTITVNYVETDGWYRFAWAIRYSNQTNNKKYFTVKPENITYDYTIYVATQEVIDLPGLMLTILGMPFSFISQAFNLTLFPGTQYSINVSNLIFAVIAALMIIIIFRKILK